MPSAIDLTAFSREQRICLALWRKAMREKDDDSKPNVQLVLSSQSTALSVRLSFYRSIKPFRNEVYLDPELKVAAENFAVTMRPVTNDPPKYVVELTPRLSLNELESQLDALGITENDILLGAEQELLDKLADFVQPNKPAPSSGTEFYTRD